MVHIHDKVDFADEHGNHFNGTVKAIRGKDQRGDYILDIEVSRNPGFHQTYLRVSKFDEDLEKFPYWKEIMKRDPKVNTGPVVIGEVSTEGLTINSPPSPNLTIA